MTDTAVLRIRVESSGIESADGKLSSLSVTGKSTESSLNKVKSASANAASQLVKTGNDAASASGGIGRFKNSAQQAGYQIQDMAVQLQGGQSALLVLGQQGSQLAMIMGPQGAVVGAIIAVASAIGGALVNAANQGTNALDKMKSKVEELTDVQKKYLAVELKKDLDEVNKKISSFNGNLEIGKTVGTGWSKTIILNNEGILEQKANLDSLNQAQKGIIDRINELNGGPSKDAIQNFKDLTYQLTLEAEAAGKGELAQKILAAQMQIGKTATKEQKDEIAKLVTEAYRKDEAFKAGEKAQTAATAAAKKYDTELQSNTNRIADARLKTQQLNVEYQNLLNGTDSISGSTSRYTIESARLAAQQQLNTKATGDQVEALARELLAQDKINESIQKGRQIRKDLKEFTQTTSEFKADATVDVNNPLSSEDAEHQKRLAKIDAFSLTEAAKTKEGQRLITTSYVAEMQRRENAVAAIQKQTALDSLSTIGSSMSGITSMLQSAGQEQTAVYKAMFFAQKAIAIPSMIVSTMDAANKALDVGGPFGGPGMAAAITAMGYANVGIAAGQAIAGAFDTGGYIPTGAYGVVSEKGDELVNGTLVKGPANVISRKDTAAMLNNESSGGNVIYMTNHQTIQVTGNGDANLVAAMQQAANQGAQMAYQAVATDFKDNKGIRRLIS